MTIWIKTTSDKYEHIVEMADSSKELAEKCGVSIKTVQNGAYKARKGLKSLYKKVRIEDDKHEGTGRKRRKGPAV